jgi:AcrR family transcriptional regulator
MYSSPDVDQYLEGLILAIDDEILPQLSTAKAQTTAVMMQAVLQQLRQTVPVFLGYLVDEHNAMLAVVREAAEALGDTTGPEAERIRDRAATLGSGAPFPAPPPLDEVMVAHRALGQALLENAKDLDVLQRSGVAEADAALAVVRAHWGPRYVRDLATITVGSGFLGRG